MNIKKENHFGTIFAGLEIKRKSQKIIQKSQNKMKNNLKTSFLTSIMLFSLCVGTQTALYAQAASSAAASRANYYQHSDQKQNIKKVASAGFYSDDALILDAKILMNVEADKMIAIFSLSQIAETSEEANRLMNERINAFSKDLLATGIAQADIFIDMISLTPNYEIEGEKKLFSRTYNEVPKGFELQKNMHIGLTDERKLQDVLALATKSEIYEFVKLEYIVNDVKKIQAQLQDEAITLITLKMEKIKKLGIILNPNNRQMAEAFAMSTPAEQYDSYSIPNQSINNKKSGKINFTKKPVISYYNKISADGFDVVINSTNTLKPVVQFTYDLKVKFVKEKPTNLVFLMPNGDLKPVQIPK